MSSSSSLPSCSRPNSGVKSAGMLALRFPFATPCSSSGSVVYAIPNPVEAIAPTKAAGDNGPATGAPNPIVAIDGGGSWIGRTPRLPDRSRNETCLESGLLVPGSEVDATLPELSVRNLGGILTASGLFPESLRREVDCDLVVRGIYFALVEGEGGPRIEDATEEMEDVADNVGRVGGKGYSKSVLAPVVNGVPTNRAGGEWTATPTAVTPLAPLITGETRSFGVRMPSELESKTSEPSSEGELGMSREGMAEVRSNASGEFIADQVECDQVWSEKRV